MRCIQECVQKKIWSNVEDAGYLQIDEKTPEALLQLDIAYTVVLRSIGGRGLMVTVLAVIYSTMKYHSVRLYVLTGVAKPRRDSIWWAVLVGRYPPKK